MLYESEPTRSIIPACRRGPFTERGSDPSTCSMQDGQATLRTQIFHTRTTCPTKHLEAGILTSRCKFVPSVRAAAPKGQMAFMGNDGILKIE